MQETQKQLEMCRSYAAAHDPNCMIGSGYKLVDKKSLPKGNEK